MTKIEAPTLEQAYRDAAVALECSITELNIEVVQAPSNGFLGLFKKNAIIIAAKKVKKVNSTSLGESSETSKVNRLEEFSSESITKSTIEPKKEPTPKVQNQPKPKKEQKPRKEKARKEKAQTQDQSMLNDTIMPQSFVSTQDDEDYDMSDINFTADYDDDEEVVEEELVISKDLSQIVLDVQKDISTLFNLTCFEIDSVDVSAYDDTTLLVEFKGKDAALLIGKEGYRYKALSYMIFNWINTKYQLQLRLEIAEFLKNQEEAVGRYLNGVYESIDRDGRCQTKILDGVLIQIALRSLREKYPNKYVAIRSTRDGLKYIIINDYHNS